MGCAHEAFSPPSGWLPAETPAPLAVGEYRLAISGGGGGVGLGGGDLVGGAVRYRQGLAGEVAREVDAEVASIVFIEDSRSDVFPAIISGRGLVRSAFSADFRHASWSAGLGAGGSAGGWFIAPEVGVQLGYDNPYVVPWFAVSGYFSLPLTSKEVDLARAEDEMAFLDRPRLTFGGRLTVGVTGKLPGLDLSVVLTTVRMVDIEGAQEAGSALGFSLDFHL
jgi:hypothetical protein